MPNQDLQAWLALQLLTYFLKQRKDYIDSRAFCLVFISNQGTTELNKQQIGIQISHGLAPLSDQSGKC
jgi:hypothetical protein